MQVRVGESIYMLSIGGQGYPSFSAGKPFQKKLNSKDEKSFVDTWASSSALWGARHGVAEAVDRFLGTHQPASSSMRANRLNDLGIEGLEEKPTGPLTYSRILKLENNVVQWKDLSCKSLKEQVKANSVEFRDAINPKNIRHFFDEVSLKDYFKQTVWEGNTRPLKVLMSGSKRNIAWNLLYTAGIGFMVFGIARTGLKHYRHWESKEDGSISSKWQTAYQTTKAVGEKSLQSLASWEAAGIGMAIGSALIPIAGIPIGGILMGAFFATTTYKIMGKLFPGLAKPGLSGS